MKNDLPLPMIFLCLLVCLHTGRATNRKYSFKQIAIEQGLSQSTVNCMLRDSRGSMWIGTTSGLNSFEKSEITCYFNELNNPASLPGNYIYTVTESKKGDILISTENGLALYNPESDDFVMLRKDKIFSSINIEGGVLFGCDDYLIFYNEETHETETIYLDKTINPNDVSYCKIVSMKKRDTSTLVICTNHLGIFLYDLKSRTIRKMDLGISIPVFSLYIDSFGTYYIGTYNSGIYVYNEKLDFMEQYTTANSGLSNNIIMDIVEINGQIWIATDGGGLNILDPVTGKITSIQHVNGDKNSLPVNSVTILYKDKDDLWAGTVRGGAIRIKEAYINSYTDVVFNSGNGVSEKAIISLFEDRDRRLWIGTDGGGINLYDPLTGRFKHYENTYREKVVSITDLSETELLLSLFGKGVFIFNKQNGTYRRLLVGDEETERREIAGYMPLVHRMSEDKIYMFARDILVYTPRTGNISYLNRPQEEVIPASVRLMYHDGENCFAAGNHTVYSLDIENDSIYPVLKIDENEKINVLSFDNDSLLWIGSNYGLSNYNIYTHEFVRVETKLFNTVSYLLHDASNRLWICSQNMLYSYISDEKRFVVWSEADGFLPNEILFMFQQKSRTGNIYLGGTNGLVIIDRNIELPENIFPVIYLRNIELNGKSVISPAAKKEIKIPYNYTSLAIVADVNERDLFRNILFRYTIHGKTESVYESYSHSLNLPSLSPGHYKIDVSCNTKTGDWTPETELLLFEITPPWYKTSLFIFLATVTGILLVFSFVTALFRRKQKKLIKKMRIQEQRMNESKIQFLINISHELRTPLTLIYAPLKRLIEKPSHEQTFESSQKTLRAIFKQADLMKDIIDMTLDINKLDAGVLTLVLSPNELNQWVESRVNDFRTEYEEKGIRLSLRLDEAIGCVDFDEGKCSIILSNLLINALKFSLPATEVCVITQRMGEMIRIAVSDQGIGLDNVQTDKLFTRFYQGKHTKKGTGIGLSYARQLVEAQGGNIGAYNNEGNGATFYYEIPYRASAPVGKLKEPEINVDTEAAEQLYDFSDKTILIVEDNEDFCSFLAETMKPLFRQVLVASNGNEGLQLVEKDSPDMIVSDVMMPGLNGFELCKRVKQNIRISHIPVILLTAKGDSESILTGYKLGADAYFGKPFQTNTLLAVIHNLFKIHQDIKELYSRGESDITPADITISPVDEAFLIKLNQLIVENIHNEQLNVDFLTGHIAMGRTSLYNKIKVLTGMGVNDYINKIRIDHACRLLLTTTKDITEIAYETGFTYQRYFSTLFKKVKGKTPSEYRIQHQKGKPTKPEAGNPLKSS